MLSGWHFFFTLTFAFVEANLFAKVKAGPPRDEFQRTLEKFSSMRFVCHYNSYFATLYCNTWFSLYIIHFRFVSVMT